MARRGTGEMAIHDNGGEFANPGGKAAPTATLGGRAHARSLPDAERRITGTAPARSNDGTGVKQAARSGSNDGGNGGGENTVEQERWRRVVQQLQVRLGKEVFNSWFGRMKLEWIS
ncbi:MAG: hypothetical protein KDJ29_03560, partial [Hyphomicrobiales bacterium]|nr:hypothetical protein [Hyphomicrobiales bacterium]